MPGCKEPAYIHWSVFIKSVSAMDQSQLLRSHQTGHSDLLARSPHRFRGRFTLCINPSTLTPKYSMLYSMNKSKRRTSEQEVALHTVRSRPGELIVKRHSSCLKFFKRGTDEIVKQRYVDGY